MPKIYTVAYGAQAGGEGFLQALAREFHGRYRKIRGLAPACERLSGSTRNRPRTFR